MPSDNALNLVNKVLRTTGDLDPLLTVVASPANIAERIIDYLNMVTKDLSRKIEFPELRSVFSGVGDGVNGLFISSIQFATVASGVNCVAAGIGNLEEISASKMMSVKASQQAVLGTLGRPVHFARQAGIGGTLAVDVYPVPQAGTIIECLSYVNPRLFLLSDTSTTDLAVDDVLVYGAIAHMDAYDGLERGYMTLYERAKNNLWQQTYQGEQYRTEVEDYR